MFVGLEILIIACSITVPTRSMHNKPPLASPLTNSPIRAPPSSPNNALDNLSTPDISPNVSPIVSPDSSPMSGAASPKAPSPKKVPSPKGGLINRALSHASRSLSHVSRSLSHASRSSSRSSRSSKSSLKRSPSRTPSFSSYWSWLKPSSKFGDVEFEAGDHIYVSVMSSVGRSKLLMPYYVYLALDNERLLQVHPNLKQSWTTVEPIIFHKKQDEWPHTQYQLECKVVKPDPELGLIGVERSVLLGYRIFDRQFPWHPITCNCRHYIDYLTYGRTFGRRWTMYWPMSERCPLYTEITEETNVYSDELVFTDNIDKEYKLNPVPPPPPPKKNRGNKGG